MHRKSEGNLSLHNYLLQVAAYLPKKPRKIKRQFHKDKDNYMSKVRRTRSRAKTSWIAKKTSIAQESTTQTGNQLVKLLQWSKNPINRLRTQQEEKSKKKVWRKILSSCRSSRMLNYKNDQFESFIVSKFKNLRCLSIKQHLLFMIMTYLKSFFVNMNSKDNNYCLFYEFFKIFLEISCFQYQFCVISQLSNQENAQIYKQDNTRGCELLGLTKMNFVRRKLECLDLIVSQKLPCLKARYLCIQGEISYREVDFGSALASFTKIVEIGSSKYFKRMWSMFISCQEKLGHTQYEIILFLEKLFQASPKNGSVSFEIAKRYQKQRKYDQAFFWYRQTTHIDPDKSDAYQGAIDMLYQQKKYPLMAPLLHQWHERNQQSLNVTQAIAVLFFLGRFQHEAIIFLQKAIRLDPENQYYYIICTLAQIDASYMIIPKEYNYKYLDKAIAFLEEHKQSNKLHENSGYRFRGRFKKLQHSLCSSSILQSLYAIKGMVLDKQEKIDESEHFYMKSIQIDSSCWSLPYESLSYNMIEKYRAKQVALCFQKIAKEGSNKVMWKAMLAFCYFYQGKYEEFTAITENIIQSNQTHRFRLLTIGLLEQLRGEYQKCIELQQEYLKSLTDTNFYLKRYAYESLTSCYDKMGNLQKATQCLNIIIQNYPEKQRAFKIKALKIYHKLGDSEKEQQMVNDCWREAQKMDIIQRVEFMNALLKAKRVDESILVYEQLLAECRKRPLIRKQIQSDLILAQCYFATNNLSESHSIYNNLLKQVEEYKGNANFAISNCSMILELIRLAFEFADYPNAEQLMGAVSIVYKIEERCPEMKVWRGMIEEERRQEAIRTPGE